MALGLLLGTASCLAWFLSALAGGGSALILIPAVSVGVGPAAVPPAITVGMLIGNGHRVGLYWQGIDWHVTRWYLPGAIAGAIGGAFVFSRLDADRLGVLLGAFLLLSFASYRWQQTLPCLQARAWHFLPAGFAYAFLSGVVGSTGPLLNPFYLSYGLAKERLIATKSANITAVHLTKALAYAAFGTLSWPYWGYGLILGAGAIPGNWLGRRALQNVAEHRFQQIVISFVAFSGALLLWQQRDWWAFWL